MKKILNDSIGIGMNNTIKSTKKNYQIQVLRAFFCLLIVFFHYTFRYSQLFNSNNIFSNSIVEYFAPFGVISFFVLSGFFLIRRKQRLSVKEKIIYWIKKILYIYIIYLIAVIIIYVLSFTGLYGEGRTVSLAVFIQNLFFIHEFLGSGYVDGAHWYIFALLCAYFFAIIYDFLPKKENGLSYLYWIAILSISLVSLLLFKTSKDGSFINSFSKTINYILCYGYFPYLFIGISLFLFDYDCINIKNVILLVFAFLSIVCVAIYSWINLIVLVCSLPLIIFSLFRKLAFLEKLKPVILLGNASYSIYLLHQNFGYLLLNLFTKIMNYYIALVLVILMAILAGVFFYLLIEKNLKRVISKMWAFQHLEPLFIYLKKNNNSSIALSFADIEKIIGQELSYAEKTDDRYWKQPRIKKLAGKYNVAFGYMDTLKGTIHFLIN